MDLNCVDIAQIINDGFYMVVQLYIDYTGIIMGTEPKWHVSQLLSHMPDIYQWFNDATENMTRMLCHLSLRIQDHKNWVYSHKSIWAFVDFLSLRNT